MTPKHTKLPRTKKTKLEQVLRQLEAKDLRKLKKFITSPYFNSNQQLINLYNIYTSCIKSEKSLPSNEEIWMKIEAKGEYNDVRYRKYESDLTQLVIRFIAAEETSEDVTTLNLLALKRIRKNTIRSLEKTLIRNLNGLLDPSKCNSNEKLIQFLSFEKERYLLQFNNKRIKDTNLNKILNILDQYYIAEKFKFGTVLTIRDKLVSRDTNIRLMDEILEAINNDEIVPEAIGEIYRLVYLTQSRSDDGDKYFLQLEHLLSERNNLIDSAEANQIYTTLINFCIGKINSGSSEYLSKLFNIYRTLINLNLILDNDRLSSSKYQNIIITALREGESDWAEKFALDYGNYLPEEIKENRLRFQLSVIYFYKKEFQKVIEVLRDFEFNDLLDNLRTKATLIQTYYELNEFDPLDSMLKSLRTYITRHKELDSGRRSNYKNLIKIMTQLIQIIPGDKKKIDKIKTMLSGMKGIAVNRTWLEEKILELEK